jgi:hypothetical protein
LSGCCSNEWDHYTDKKQTDKQKGLLSHTYTKVWSLFNTLVRCFYISGREFTLGVSHLFAILFEEASGVPKQIP